MHSSIIPAVSSSIDCPERVIAMPPLPESFVKRYSGKAYNVESRLGCFNDGLDADHQALKVSCSPSTVDSIRRSIARLFLYVAKRS